MKISEMFVGQKVFDSWWPEHEGVVVKVYKKTVHVAYPSRDATWIYDKEHFEGFLK